MQGLHVTPRSRRICAACCLAAGVWMGWSEWLPDTACAAPVAAEGPSPALAQRGVAAVDRAITRWSDTARQRPQDASAWVNLGDALMQKARETLDSGYYSRAEAAYEQALALQPDHVSALTGMAWVTSAQHEFERSREWARQAIAHDPQHQPVYGLLGDAAMEMGDYAAALTHYQHMLDIRPDLASYSRSAHLLYVTGNTRQAVWLMRKAIAAGAPHAENTAWCRAQLALLLWHTGALVAAEQTLTAALQETPHNYHLLAAMGRVQASRKQYDAAITSYKQASAIAPQHEVVLALGDIYALTGKQEEAEKQYALVETIHKLNTANGVRGNLQMAHFYADHDRNLSTALEIAEAEYKQRPTVFAADTLAWCYYKNGRYAEARQAITKALSQRTPDASFFFHAGMIYARLGDRRSAQKQLYHALSLNPTFHPVYAEVAADTLKQLAAHPPAVEQSKAP